MRAQIKLHEKFRAVDGIGRMMGFVQHSKRRGAHKTVIASVAFIWSEFWGCKTGITTHGGIHPALRMWRAMPILCLIICLAEAFDPVDNYLIDCGSPTNTSVDGRIFAADTTPSSLLSAPHYVFATTDVTPKHTLVASADQSRLYKTAIIFTTTSNYTFPIRRKGRHWIRLYFFPVVYGTRDTKFSSFSVSVQSHDLLSNFVPNNASMFKEFSLNVTSDTLVLSFVPSDNSFAFLNALEVVSTPDKLIGAGTVRSFSSWASPDFANQALETVVRANIGGPAVPSQNDTLWRTWDAGHNFLVAGNKLALDISNVTAVKYVAGGPTEDIAPLAVYGTATILNTTDFSTNSNSFLLWAFIVEPGFHYLVRCHFCAIVSDIRSEFLYKVYVNYYLASEDTDLGQLTNKDFGHPYYIDFVTELMDSESICVAIGPFLASTKHGAILNGVEVMKLNNSFGNLGKGMLKSGPSQPKNEILIVGVGIAVLSALVGIFIVTCIRRRKRRRRTDSNAKAFMLSLDGGKGTAGSKVTSSSALHFPFAAVQEATNNFDESCVIGVGGFGKVYKGILLDNTKVAAKRLNPQSQQGLAEFRTEIELLSKFRHQHLVSLIGYCDEGNEMILVYEFMENGTLGSHLYGLNFPSLGWKERLQICIGAAKGLHYLHYGSVAPVIHCDVKSSNILLDKSLMAKVADFGLSRTIQENDRTHVSTVVRGTFGYLDPEYFKRRRLTTKSDVYSFGVVLIEVLCARPVLDSSLGENMNDLAQWAMKHHKAGQLEKIIDPNLTGGIMPECLMKFVETAEKCLASCGVDRPTMEEVLFNLEHALQLQEAVLEHQGNREEIISNRVGELAVEINNLGNMDASATCAEKFNSSRADDQYCVSSIP